MTLHATIRTGYGFPLPEVRNLDDIDRLITRHVRAYVRFSAGPEADRQQISFDHESGAVLPGISVNALHAESWWKRPRTEWIARQICQHADIADHDTERFAWVLTGNEIGRGPHCEPLMTHVRPLARLHRSALAEARSVYDSQFRTGVGPGGSH